MCDDHFRYSLVHQPDAIGVGVDARGKTLVGDIDERNQALRNNEIRDLAPLFNGQVHASRVVTTSVQQNQVALGCLL